MAIRAGTWAHCAPWLTARAPRPPRPAATAAIAAGEAAVHTGRPSARRAARSRRAENEQTQTRSQAAVRRSTPASGAIAAGCLMSMLNRASGQLPSRSSSFGIGSRPSIRAVATVR